MGKILIIDDVKFTAVNLANILNSLEYEDVSVKYGIDESLDFYIKNEKSIDLVFLSILITPGKDIESAIELVKKFKFFNNDVKIIIISTKDEKQKVLKAIQHGALDFVHKPLKSIKIKEILKKLNI